jgi:hypothetical protein
MEGTTVLRRSVADPHHSEKQDPVPHHGDADPQLIQPSLRSFSLREFYNSDFRNSGCWPLFLGNTPAPLSFLPFYAVIILIQKLGILRSPVSCDGQPLSYRYKRACTLFHVVKRGFIL